MITFSSYFMTSSHRKFEQFDHRHLIYTRWCIPHCGQAKIEVGSQALVVPTNSTWSMIICVFCNAEMDKVDNKSSLTQLKSIYYTNAETGTTGMPAAERPIWPLLIAMRGYRPIPLRFLASIFHMPMRYLVYMRYL